MSSFFKMFKLDA